MLDIDGLSLTPADRDLLCESAVGGVILFARNYESPEQVIDLVAEIRALRSPPLIVAVDHEGGRVQRFREGFSSIPPMRRIGREFNRDPAAAENLARQAGWLIGSELGATGIDLCFAPCLDLDWGVSEVIGDRAFHRQPDAVGELAAGLTHEADGDSAIFSCSWGPADDGRTKGRPGPVTRRAAALYKAALAGN